MRFWKWKKQKQQIPLSKIIQDLKEALYSDIEAFESYQIQRLRSFYNPDGTPITMKFQANTQSEFEIPLFMLVNHTILHLHEFSFSFQADADALEIDKLKKEFTENGTEPFMVSFSKAKKGKGSIQIEISLKKSDKQPPLYRLN